MTDEGDTLRNFAFGDLNPVRPRSPRTPSLTNQTTPQAALRESVVQTHTPNAFAGLTVFQGIILRVEEDTVTTEPGEPTGIVDSILSAIGVGNAGATVRKKYKIRIPEIDAMLLMPSRVAASYSEAGEHQAVIDTYATFTAQSTATEPASPGDLVWVTFQNVEDREGGIYLGKVISQAGNATESGNAAPSARGAFNANCTSLPGITSSNPISGVNSCAAQDCAVLAGGIPRDPSLIHVPGTTGRRSSLRRDGGTFTGLYTGRQGRAESPLQATGYYEPIRNYYRQKAQNRRYHRDAPADVKEALGLMTMSDAGRHMLRILEGNESKVYLDLTSGAARYPNSLASRPARNGRTSRPTVGVGLLLFNDERHRELWTPYLTPGPASLSTDEAEDLYGYVIDEHCNRFIRLLKVVPTQNQFDGLASAVFNAGVPSWLREAISAINAGNPQQAKNLIVANGANAREHRKKRREREGELMTKADSTGGASLLPGMALYANYNKVEGTRQGDLPHWGMRYFGTRIQVMQQIGSTSGTSSTSEGTATTPTPSAESSESSESPSPAELTPPEEAWLQERITFLSRTGSNTEELEEEVNRFRSASHPERARIMEEQPAGFMDAGARAVRSAVGSSEDEE